MPSIKRRPPTDSDEARLVIDQQYYLPIFFTGIANQWSRGASKVFLHLYGVGFLDWVVISMLAVEPGTTALGICQNTSSDKAAVSRCLSQLESKRLVTGEAEGRDPRRRRLQLTAEGYRLHDKLMAIAVERENQLLQGLGEDDIATLVGLLRRVKSNIQAIKERDTAAVSPDRQDLW